MSQARPVKPQRLPHQHDVSSIHAFEFLLLCTIHMSESSTWASTISNIGFKLDTIPTHVSILLQIWAMRPPHLYHDKQPTQDVDHGLQQRLGGRDGGQGMRHDCM
jgi:hypothetical protein